MTRAIAQFSAHSWAEATELPAEEAMYLFRDILRGRAESEYEQSLLRHAILVAGGAQDLKAPTKTEY